MDMMSKHTAISDKNDRPDLSQGSTAVLTVDLAAIGRNYARLAAMADGAQCAAVVKADAYGTGAHRVAPHLHKLGCENFFVATIKEGIALRKLLAGVKIHVFDGLFPGSADLFDKHQLIPVLGSLAMLKEWSEHCRKKKRAPPAVLHIDTGMNRLGIGPDDLSQLIEQQKDHLQDIRLDLVMSHLACADDQKHALNQKQLTRFKDALGRLPGAPASLANSAGIFLGSDFHLDLLRPGIALYGGRPNECAPNPMEPVVTLISHIAQIRRVEKGVTIGYGGTYTTTRQTRLATIPVGYADGYLRALGSSTKRAGAHVFVGDHKAPLLGRVSMDLITVDITDVPQSVAFIGTDVELLGAHILIDDLADIAGTIGYEILTSLGTRYDVHYRED